MMFFYLGHLNLHIVYARHNVYVRQRERPLMVFLH